MAYEFHYTPTGTGVISGKEVLEQTEDAINDLGGQISGDVQTAIDTANNALNTANTASADAQNAINTANTAYTAATNAQNTANTAQNTASNALTAAQNAQNDVNALGNRVTTAEGNITQNTNAITGLTTRMGTAEGNIGNLQTAVSTAQATANSAQQTATTARQQAYVLRYSSTAITDNSTIAYSTLDNTDNIKADDKIIDVDGKIFSVVSVDSDNSTVTVGTALIDLALDANVMHLSGDETVGGIKSFTGTRTEFKRANNDGVVLFNNDSFSKGDTPSDTTYLCRKYYGGTTSIPTAIGYSSVTVSDQGNRSMIQFYCLANTAGATTRTTLQMNYDKSLTGSDAQYINITGNILPNADNTYSLGNSSNKWKQINGINPGALSLPDLNNGIDISGFVDVTQTSQYTAPADGHISICGYASSTNAILIKDHDYDFAMTARALTTSLGATTYLIIPVVKNHVYEITCSAVTTLSYAYFYPCLGNV